MKEIWKDIEGYEGVYHVSNLGRVKRVATGRVLNGMNSGSGYVQVGLYKQGVVSRKLIHRLVAQAFIPNPEHKSE
ncbi:NUMOD4 domain-containing protein, partial [Arthrospira platensis SPKY2]